MTEKKTAFFAYPGTPADIGQSIKKAITSFNSFVGSCQIEAWEQNDISGLPLVAPTQAAPPEDWSSVCISHYGGEPWLQFMAGHALMRPRNLLKLFRYSLGYAINSSHLRIEEPDIARGLKTYAQDLVLEVDREISDVFPKARKLIYEFSEENGEFSHDDLSTLIQCAGIDEHEAEKVISFLIYYGVLGIRRTNEDAAYIYDVNYDIEMLKVRIRKWSESALYVVNPALWPALQSKKYQPLLV